MRILLTRIIIFTIIVCLSVVANIMVFRTDFPYMAFITTIGSVMGFIYFPYNKFFNIKNKN